MQVEVAVAGAICVLVGLGHATVGLVWVLPRLAEHGYPATGLGPPSMTDGMVRVTWHVVTVFALTIGGVLLSLGWDASGDARTVVLRWIAALWIAATAVGMWTTWRHRRLVRLGPVPLLWVIVAALCWSASA